MYLMLMFVPTAILSLVLGVVQPALINLATPFLYNLLKGLSSKISDLPAQVHVVVVAFLSWALPQVVALVPGLSASTVADLANPTAASTLAGFAVTQVVHALIQANKTPTPPAPSTPAAPVAPATK